MNPITGIVPPVLTPFTPDGVLDQASLARLVDHLLGAEVDGLFVLGSSGQVAYLTDDEREAVIGLTVDQVGGRVPVLAGVIDLTARRVIEHARRAQSAGADAVVVTAPLYALNDADEIDAHFRMLAEAISIPIFAYDIPVRVHHKLDGDRLLALGQDGVIAGVKDSSGDDDGFEYLIAINNRAGHPLNLLTGHEIKCDAMFRAGAEGAIPGLANVDPAGYVRLWRAAQQGAWDEAQREQERLTQLFGIVDVPSGRSLDTTGIGAFKAALAMLGVVETATMPAPLGHLRPDEIESIGTVLSEVGLR